MSWICCSIPDYKSVNNEDSLDQNHTLSASPKALFNKEFSSSLKLLTLSLLASTHSNSESFTDEKLILVWAYKLKIQMEAVGQ